MCLVVQPFCVPKKGDLVLVRAYTPAGFNRLGGFGTITALDFDNLVADVKPIIGGTRLVMKRIRFQQMVRVDEEPDPLEPEVPEGSASASVAFSAAAAGVPTAGAAGWAARDVGVDAGGGGDAAAGRFAGSLSVDKQISLLKKKRRTRW